MKKYTIINPDPTLQSNLMAFGWQCGKGWYPLIEELIDKLQMIENKQHIGLEITEIKEKYGGLRVYTNIGTDEIWDLIDGYERKSFTICEQCGKPGSLRNNHGWFTTLCDKRQKKMSEE